MAIDLPFPKSLPDFQRLFPDDAACAKYLEELPLLSASQYELWTQCQRKWGFKYLDKVDMPKHPGAILGTEVDDEQIQPWLERGRGFDFTRPSGEIALALSTLLPAPGTPGLQVQRKFVIPSLTGRFEWQGKIDIFAPDSGCVPGFDHDAEDYPELVGDTKTTGDLRWMKDAAMLETDIQAQLYATAVMVQDAVDIVDLVWFYVRTKKPHRAQRSHLRVDVAHASEQFGKIDAGGGELIQVKLARPNVNDLRPTFSMCLKYGGCQYQHLCNFSPTVQAAAINQEAIEHTMNASTNDFLAQLRKQIQSPTVPTVALAVTAAPAEMQAATAAPAEVPAATLPGLPDWVTESRHAAPAINPPESQLPPAQAVGVAVHAVGVAVPAVEKRTRRTKSDTEAASGFAHSEVKASDSTNVSLESEAEVLKHMRELVSTMRSCGVKRLALMSGQIYEIEMFKP